VNERNEVNKHPAYRSTVTTNGGEKRTLLLLVASKNADGAEAKRRAEENAAIDAESILEQAAEANALDPVG